MAVCVLPDEYLIYKLYIMVCKDLMHYILQLDHHAIIDCLNNAALCCWLAPPFHFLTAFTALNVNGLYLTELQRNDVKLKP